MGRFIYRLPPYWEYDMEGIESWLEDLHAKGLVLDKDGYVFGFMQFQRGEPQRVKYRLEAIQKVHAFKFPDDPDEKTQSFYEEFGWEYLGQFREFYIYRNCDPSAPELNTDPAIQAMSLNALKKRGGLWLFVMALTVVWGAYVLITKGRIIANLINEGWLPTLLLPAFLLAAVVISLASYMHIARLHRKLKRGEPLKRNKNWRKGLFLRRTCCLLLVVLWLVPKNSMEDFLPDPGADTAIRVAEFHGDAPIVTMAEMAPEWEHVSQHDGVVRQWEDVLSPVNLFWAESAQLESPDGEKYIGSLEVNYHETADMWIAEALVKDFTAEFAQYQNYTSVPLNAADYGFDYLAVSENYAYAKIIIRSGCTVIKVNCSIKNGKGNEHLYPLWLELMAEKLA